MEIRQLPANEYDKALDLSLDVFKTAILNQPVSEMTVNSSSYATPIYRKLGFEPVCEEQVTHGMKYTPMKRMGTKVRELEKVC